MMIRRLRLAALHLTAVVLTTLPVAAIAQVSVENAWVRGTVPAQKATGAFMRLKSATPTALVNATTPAAGRVELHEMRMENDVMKMKAVPKIDIAAGKPTDLKPGGLHVMLFDLKKPLLKGESIQMTLEFQDAVGKRSQQTLSVEVRDLTADAKGGHHHKH
jgi:hypothetical protein